MNLISFEGDRSSVLKYLFLQCVDKFFSLGESKMGVFNILVDYACSIWRKILQPSNAKKGCTHKAELVTSLQAHIQLVVRACTFGTVHRKNLRFERLYL